MNNNTKNFSPLTEATYYILLSVVNPLHGYGIIKKIKEMSNGRVSLAAGTLYGAISTLLKNELIISVDEDSENKRRKLYKITKLGITLVKYEISRLQELTNSGMQQIGKQKKPHK